MSEPNDAVRALRAYGEDRATFWIDPPRGDCEAGCGEKDVILHETEAGLKVCANCYRQQSDRHKPYPCDNCGSGPAFRDPLGREDEMLCTDCHARKGYVPGERAMVTKLAKREGVTHSMARRVQCSVAHKGTPCGGQVKQRGRVGVLCDKHFDPVKYAKARQE